MSGIAGIYHLNGRPVDSGLLERMLECIAHRGPDGARIWIERGIGLGHRQFCTTEESLRELQPAGNHSGSCRVTMDGRIDNREELWLRLGIAHGKVADATDCDLLLWSYEQWGTECLKWLVGDYAFALWDRERRQLFCARDTYGIRPFYYHFDGETFLLASDCRQIFEDPRVSVRVDEEKIAEWFTWCGILSHSYRNLRKSFFQEIFELPPAHYLVVNDSGVKLRRYWDVNPAKEIRYRRRQEYADHFASVLKESVRCRLRSATPVGAELSGGYDSSSIVCLAAEILRSQNQGKGSLATFSLVFDELSCDERPVIDSVVKKYQLESHQIVSDGLCGLSGVTQADGLPFDLNSPDQPHSVKALQALYQLAHSAGIRVMLSGEGAEPHVLGNRFVLDSLIRHLRCRELLARLRLMLAESSCRSVLSATLRFGIAPVLLGKAGIFYYYRWLHSELDRDSIPGFFNATFAAKCRHELSQQRERLLCFTRFSEWGRQLAYEGLTPGSSALVRDISPDRVVERRFPYHDRRLIEYCLAIPPEEKFYHLRHTRKRTVRGRALQREGLQEILPTDVLQSTAKVNFDDMSKRRMRELKQIYFDLYRPAAAPRVSQLGIIDAARFWTFLTDLFAGLEKNHRFEPGSYFWLNRVTQLEIWLGALSKLGSTRANYGNITNPADVQGINTAAGG